MKTLLIISVILLGAAAKKARTTKHRFNIKNLRTPKGNELSNHFGSDPMFNSYGPKPELVSHEALIQNSDGTVAKRYIKRIIRADTPDSSRGCDITQKDYSAACLNIDSCDICAASPHCGWCELQQRCFPKQLKDDPCPDACINGWVFGSQSCKGEVRSGHFGKWGVDTDNIRTVEYSYPKYKVDTVYTAPQVVRTPVILGSVATRNALVKKNAQTNSVAYISEQNTVKPIYGEIHQVLPVDVHSTQYIDTFSGKRVDMWGEKNIQFHGVDGPVQVLNDLPIKRELERPRRMSTWQKQKLLEKGSHHA